jgi:membrane protein implicated in regulation of membrane protease activity
MRFTIQLLAAMLAFGCAQKEAPAPAKTEATTAAPAHEMPAVAAHAMTPSTAAPAPAAAAPLSGTVVETMDSGGYTYLKLKTAGGEKWAAVRATKVAKGQQVTVTDAMEMRGFESKTLNRSFDSIWFGNLGADANPPAGSGSVAGQQAAMNAMAAQHAAAAQGPADVGDVKVPKAEGADGRTVAEVFAKRADLKDKSVTVRGKVVKSLTGIMGKNWIHLRDGSGSVAAKDDDLTVTTSGTAAVGDVVVVKGVVHVARDFGAGYSYPVIVEDATIVK